MKEKIDTYQSHFCNGLDSQTTYSKDVKYKQKEQNLVFRQQNFLYN